MKILIKNCNLISMNLKEPENKIQKNMDILIENEKIIKISKHIKDSAEKSN